MSRSPACPDPGAIKRLALGELAEPEAEQLGQHVLVCSYCTEVLGSIQAGDPLIADIQAAHRHEAAYDWFADGLVEGLAAKPRDFTTEAGTLEAASLENHESQGRVPLEELPGFEVLGELGRGGMGIVFKARQIGLDRLVALKMIRAGEYASQEDLARFLTEAQAVARLQHPRIVQIFEVGRHQNRPYFVMELLDGGSLKTRLDGKPQEPRYAAQVGEGLAAAVQFAHGAESFTGT